MIRSSDEHPLHPSSILCAGRGVQCFSEDIEDFDDSEGMLISCFSMSAHQLLLINKTNL
jgi:hypothetical protein